MKKKYGKGFKNALEEHLAALNANVFWREFSFSKNEFFPSPAEPSELADHVVWIEDLLIAYQLKERTAGPRATAHTEQKWFERKVLGDATRQVRDTLRYLEEHEEIEIENQRGHAFKVSGRALKKVVKLVVYAPAANLPEDCRRVKHHISSSGAAGLIHVLPVDAYLEICRTLFTPAEIAEYFDFRERTIEGWPEEAFRVSERALLGQFLSGDEGVAPDERYTEYLASFENDVEEFDLTFLLRDFAEHTERVITQRGENDYYLILAEFAKLSRGDLREVKQRLQICTDVCNAGDHFPVTRVAVPKTDCGFVFVPVPRGVADPFAALVNFTAAAKYDLRVRKQIGVSLARDGRDFIINWCFMDSPWEYDAEMEEQLRRSYPFLSVKGKYSQRYTFGKGVG